MSRALYRDGTDWAEKISKSSLEDEHPPSVHLDRFNGYDSSTTSYVERIWFGCSILQQSISGALPSRLAEHRLRLMMSFEIGFTQSVEVWDRDQLEQISSAENPAEILVVRDKNFFYPFVESFKKPLDFTRFSKIFGSMYSCSRVPGDALDGKYIKHVIVYRLSDT